MTTRFVTANPYPWPYHVDLRPDDTALMVIDMETDFSGVSGYVDVTGYDLSLTRAPIEPIRAVPAAMRAAGSQIIHTKMVTMQGGVFGAVAPSAALLDAIGKLG